MKIKKRVVLPLIVIAGIFAGPRVQYPSADENLPDFNISINELDKYLAEKEAKIENLKPDNEARIVWVDSARQTPYSIVYLHGWSGQSRGRRSVHEELAKRYGCNLCLTRLAGHGIDSKDSFKELT